MEQPRYRIWNLRSNGIHLRSPDEDLPQALADLVQIVCKDRDDPSEPSFHQLKHDKRLHQLENGVVETVVEDYFKDTLFPKPLMDLGRADNQPMCRDAVPDSGSQYKLGTPIPDLLFGYNLAAFSQQKAHLMSMGTTMMANKANLVYPFLVVEFKGDGPLWVATNQCAGGSASCVKIAERLNSPQTGSKGDQTRVIESAAFSIAMNGTEARLYITWKHDDLDSYYMRKINSFLLQQPDQHLEFRKHVKNIIDWGRGARLEGIREALDSLGRRAEAQTIPASSLGTKRRASELSSRNVKRAKRPVS